MNGYNNPWLPATVTFDCEVQCTCRDNPCGCDNPVFRCLTDSLTAVGVEIDTEYGELLIPHDKFVLRSLTEPTQDGVYRITLHHPAILPFVAKRGQDHWWMFGMSAPFSWTSLTRGETVVKIDRVEL